MKLPLAGRVMDRHLLASSNWQHDLRERFLRYLLLKVAGISAFTWLFFEAYFHILRSPVYSVQQMPLTSLDALVPFQPGMFWVYVSLWVYVGVAPGLMWTLRELLGYGAWAAGLCVSGLLAFYFWPTSVPPHGLDVSSYPGFSVLTGLDAAGNACPSLHVATAIFSYVWVGRILRSAGAPVFLHALNAVWAVLICWSTVAIRQHVVIDVAAGLVLGVFFAWISAPLGTQRGRRSA